MLSVLRFVDVDSVVVVMFERFDYVPGLQTMSDNLIHDRCRIVHIAWSAATNWMIAAEQSESYRELVAEHDDNIQRNLSRTQNKTLQQVGCVQ